ncbi:MAG: four helix bundle protein [Chloroflexia bacterium]|nr:four helix bundle protein [Chloroflexia bacterium]
MNIFEMDVYKLSMKVGEKVWSIVAKWNYFDKDTVGKQLVRAMDSVAANLSEGFGRYHYKEKKNFSYYSRGSLYESRTWLEKGKNRNLLSEDDFIYFKTNINSIGRILNGYINAIGKYPENNKVEEPEENYYSKSDDIFFQE